MYRPPHHNLPVLQLFWGGTNAIKSTAETVFGKETTNLSTKNQDAMELEFQVLPMMVYLLIYQEYERRRRRPQYQVAWESMEAGLDSMLPCLRLQTGGVACACEGAASGGGRIQPVSCSLGQLPTGDAAAGSGPTLSCAGGGAYNGACGGAAGGTGHGAGAGAASGGGGSLYYSPKKVCQMIIACCMLHNLALRQHVPFLQEDEPGNGFVAAVEPVDSEEEEAEEEDVDNRINIIHQYFQ
ncbi:hypothetical protein NDU88_003808 [Pleurodeles waltl]|uniref:Nuclease HARBI1 n=1 Tax=Pleurodeles waltl TaxID=8319 RepID=A0AAV7LJM6_PLEWA|nr:hypothetical protein NDU88_003808 [Pleurodeles waltl]